jgi:hypothetical protein
MDRTRRIVLGAFAIAALAAATAPGEVVRLRDASTLKGRLVRVDGDTLTFRTSFGAVRIARSQIASIAFDDSTGAALAPALPAAGGAGPAYDAGAKGTIEVVFKDRELSSKIAIDKKKLWDEHVAANQIVLEFLVDGRVAHAAVDSTIDKRIYQGHTTVLKNETELADFAVEVPAGLRHAKLVVRNADPDTFRGDFEPEPLNLVLSFENLDVRAGEIIRLDVGIGKGKLKMGRPRLYRAE